MAKARVTKRKAAAKKTTATKATVKKSAMQKRAHPTKVKQVTPMLRQVVEPQKNAFEERFGEGTAFDLDYGKLLIIGLCVYIAIQVS